MRWPKLLTPLQSCQGSCLAHVLICFSLAMSLSEVVKEVGKRFSGGPGGQNLSPLVTRGILSHQSSTAPWSLVTQDPIIASFLPPNLFIEFFWQAFDTKLSRRPVPLVPLTCYLTDFFFSRGFLSFHLAGGNENTVTQGKCDSYTKGQSCWHDGDFFARNSFWTPPFDSQKGFLALSYLFVKCRFSRIPCVYAHHILNTDIGNQSLHPDIFFTKPLKNNGPP